MRLRTLRTTESAQVRRRNVSPFSLGVNRSTTQRAARKESFPRPRRAGRSTAAPQSSVSLSSIEDFTQ